MNETNETNKTKARIWIGGAGGAPSNNFIKSIREGCPNDYLIGATSQPSDIFLADVEERLIIPPAMHPTYKAKFLALLEKTRPDFIHLQHDFEIREVSRMREEVTNRGVKTFLPAKQTIEDCVDKGRSYQIWVDAGLPVPKTILVNNESDLKMAFDEFGGEVWLRATEGGGGKGALPANDFEFAKLWIGRFNGWGNFTAAECLTPDTVTWLSMWNEGDLVVAQTRKRRSWSFGDRTLSGVTGITGVAETCSFAQVDDIALAAIKAVDEKPHGIYGVDMTYDAKGVPNPTEINIGRFFTTHYFFTKAGLNMPQIMRDIVIEEKLPRLSRKINPLPDGLVWIRGMDVSPVLTTVAELEKYEKCLI